jgi:S-adenosyl methyltransferase
MTATVPAPLPLLLGSTSVRRTPRGPTTISSNGKDNFPADRAAAKALLAVVPQARQGARENRAFLQRAVRFLAAEVGIGQFLDIGTGIPTQGNLHQVAQAITPGARVVYADKTRSCTHTPTH